MSLVTKLIHAVKRNRPPAPRPGVLLRPRKEDALRDYPADGLTPSRLASILHEADRGSLSAQMALFEQMEEKDAHLYSVANTRRLAITGLPWEVVSAAEMPGGGGRSAGRDRRAADEAAAYCDAALRDCDGFAETLAHLSLALGRNLAVAELVWEGTPAGLRLNRVVPVDFNRLALGELDELRVLTDEAPYDGIKLPPHKFIVHAPHATCGHPGRGGLLRVTALAFVAKHFALKDWMIFAEVFGMPVRIARYAPNATLAEKRELLDMLKQLGADATGIFSKAVEVEIQQTRMPGETNLYENLCLYCDREVSKAWLGQTLTTDTVRMLASAGAATIHDRVRRDIRDDDLRKEAHTLRRDLLTPLVRLRFGPDTPAPYFRRVIDQTLVPEELAKVLSVAVNELGARVPARWAHGALGIPQAAEGEPSLPGNTTKPPSP
jgi:phage gp29-like protein